MYNVLVVDDEYIIQDGISRAFNWKKLGFRVSGTANNGVEALKMIKKNKPDVVLTDVRMPKMNGIELVQNISLQYPWVKTIILSGYSDFKYAQKAIEYGVYSYLLKPIKRNELSSVLVNISKELENDYKEKFSKNFYDNMKSCRDNKYYKLFFDENIDEEIEYLNEFKKKKIDIKNSSKCVCAFKIHYTPNTKKEEKLLSKMSELTCNYWNKENRVYIIQENIIYVLLIEHKTLLYKEVFEESQKFLEYLKKNKESKSICVSCGIGNIYKNTKEIRKSTLEAKNAVGYTFYSGKGSINSYDRNSSEKTENDFICCIEKITDSIIMLDKINLQKQMDKLLEMLKDCAYIDTQLIFAKCVHLYMSIIFKLADKGFNIKDRSEKYFYERIKKVETYVELSNIFKEEVYLLFEYMGQTARKEHYNNIYKIKKYIKNNLEVDLSLEKISNEFFISSSYLSTLFKNKAGINVSEYIQKCRIEKSKSLIRNSDSQIKVVAEMVGFTDYRYFCTVFKKYTGTSPLKFRLNQPIK